MKQFSISVFLLLFHYCLAPHFACPKERPFISKANECGSFNDICIKYRSVECEFGISACQQCPLSNFSSAILDRVLRIMYGGEDKTGSQPRNDTKLIQECPTNRLLWSILFIVSFLLICSTLISLYFICQCIRNQKELDCTDRNSKKSKEIQKDLIITKLEVIAEELSILPNKIKSEKPIEISISWKDAENGFVPSGAIEVTDSCIVARAAHKREYIPGKLIPNDKCVYIGYGGQEISKSHYQVLVDTSILKKPVLNWKNASCQDIPPLAIIGGTDNGKAIYIARDVIEGEDVLGKFQPEHGGAYFPFKDKEVYKKEPILILCYSRM